MNDTLGRIEAPWTPTQVAALDAFQHRGDVHPFTCGREECRSTLVATTEGWICPIIACGYKQNWAWAFMAEFPPIPPECYGVLGDASTCVNHGGNMTSAGVCTAKYRTKATKADIVERLARFDNPLLVDARLEIERLRAENEALRQDIQRIVAAHADAVTQFRSK